MNENEIKVISEAVLKLCKIHDELEQTQKELYKVITELTQEN